MLDNFLKEPIHDGRPYPHEPMYAFNYTESAWKFCCESCEPEDLDAWCPCVYPCESFNEKFNYMCGDDGK